MRKIVLTYEQLEQLDRIEPVGVGSEGVVYQINEDTCIKLLYPANCKPCATSSISVDAKKLSKLVTELSQYKDIILTDLAQGLVYFEDRVIGSILYYYENTQPLSKLLRTPYDTNIKNIIKSLKSLVSASFELANAGINDRDLTPRNVLVDENFVSHIIDLDNLYLDIEDQDEILYNSTKSQLDEIMLAFLELRNDFFTNSQYKRLKEYLLDYAFDEDSYYFFLEQYYEEYYKVINGEDDNYSYNYYNEYSGDEYTI